MTPASPSDTDSGTKDDTLDPIGEEDDVGHGMSDVLMRPCESRLLFLMPSNHFILTWQLCPWCNLLQSSMPAMDSITAFV